MADYDFFEVIVVGDNPEEIISQYDKNKQTEPILLYKYSDAEILKAQYVQVAMSALHNTSLSEKESIALKEKINNVISMTASDFYFDFTSEYDLDPNTNDAYSTNNSKGKWSSYRKGRFFSIPFITKDEKEVFQAKKGDINWSLMHRHNTSVYAAAWDMVMENKKPETEDELLIFENMKNRTMYFQKFSNRENYVNHSTSFWAYAIVDKNTWKDMDDEDNEFDWVANFYQTYIEPLDDDVLLTIYECRK